MLESIATLTLVDQELVTERNNWSGATLTVTRQGISSADDQFGASGSLSLTASNLLVSSTNIGSYTNSGGTLELTFNSNATASLVNTALQNITYSNAVTTPGDLSYNSVILAITINDQNNNNTGSGTAGSGQDQGGGGLLTAVGTITVNIDRLPVTPAQTTSITEDATPNTATGNVISGAGASNSPATDQDGDTLAVQGIVSGSNSGPVSNTNVGNTVSGNYGSIVLNTDGSYTYTLNNNNPTVNGLLTSQTLQDTYTYTINDGRGGTSTTTLTITINGHTDGAPTITPVDANDSAPGQITVYEKGLVTPSDNSQTTTGAITLSALDGLTSVSVAGQSFNVEALNHLTTTPVAITTSSGILTLTGFTTTTSVGGVTTTGTLNYSYSLPHNLIQTGGTDSTDTIALVITNAADTSSNGSLVVDIINDVPTANPDTASVTESNTAVIVSGNVVTNDRIGADTTATPVSAVSFNGVPYTVGSAFASTYGNLILNADGNYTYTLNNSNAAVSALPFGQTLTETFTYTITDSDGNHSTTVLTITINGTFSSPGSSIQLANPTPSPFTYSPPSTPSTVTVMNPVSGAKNEATTSSNDFSSPSQQAKSQDNALNFELSLVGSVRNQLVTENQNYSFQIPASIFVHSNPNEQLVFEATTSSGKALPAWLNFDPKTLKFSGVPPKGVTPETVTVTAKDSYGKEVSATFKVGISKEDNTQTKPQLDNQQGDIPVLPNTPSPNASIQKPISNTRLVNHFEALHSKQSFTQQVHMAGKLSRLQESRALLDSLKNL